MNCCANPEASIPDQSGLKPGRRLLVLMSDFLIICLTYREVTEKERPKADWSSDFWGVGQPTDEMKSQR